MILRGMALCFSLIGPLSLNACSDNLPAYVVKQGLKQGRLILRSQDIDSVLARPSLDPKTESYLKLAKQVVLYAHDELGMHTGQNYRKYIQLDRPWVTEVVTAAHHDKLEPFLFHYPIVGDLPYKGYFDESDAIALEEKLKSQGYDTYRRKVEAFSTAGWLPDPLTSSMLSERSRLIELLFHELTHATFYFKSYADFNEAFASWMGYKGALQFIDSSLKPSDAPELKTRLEADHKYQLAFAHVVKEILKKGHEEYASSKNIEATRKEYFDWIEKRLASDPLFAEHAKTRSKTAPKIQWNNALLLSLGTYYELVEPIDQYARDHKLSPKEFLALVTKSGPSIVPQILATRVLASDR
jgi:predicted aminopeptidase